MATRKDELELQTDALRMQARVRHLEKLAANKRFELSLYTDRYGFPAWTLRFGKEYFTGKSLLQVIEKAATDIMLKEIKQSK